MNQVYEYCQGRNGEFIAPQAVYAERVETILVREWPWIPAELEKGGKDPVECRFREE